MTHHSQLTTALPMPGPGLEPGCPCGHKILSPRRRSARLRTAAESVARQTRCEIAGVHRSAWFRATSVGHMTTDMTSEVCLVAHGDDETLGSEVSTTTLKSAVQRSSLSSRISP